MMFRTLGLTLAGPLGGEIEDGGPLVFASHPMQLSRYLEELWINRPDPGEPPTQLRVPPALVDIEATSDLPLPAGPIWWEHLIYAYMVENTRAYEIFRRVVEEYAYGERLGTPTDGTQQWLRTTEQLFYSDHAPYQIHALQSWIRPDIRATRRNAYFRMFGFDLNHGTDDNRPYPYPRAAAANTEFAPTFERLLREVWVGIENFDNSAGADPTDDATVANLAHQIDDMLSVRREGGNFAREELVHVAAMSWFHLTVSYDSDVVIDLEAQANSPEERLLKIGERVGLPAHSRSAAYFRLADDMSLALRSIEAALFNDSADAPDLYDPTTPIGRAMRSIVRDWSNVTGRDLKVRPVAVAPSMAQPVRPPTQPIVPVVPAGPTDGRARVTRETLPV
jgi:hypothetical protein